jgi:hypothetical protein
VNSASASVAVILSTTKNMAIRLQVLMNDYASHFRLSETHPPVPAPPMA